MALRDKRNRFPWQRNRFCWQFNRLKFRLNYLHQNFPFFNF
jgi:hypothetical protein